MIDSARSFFGLILIFLVSNVFQNRIYAQGDIAQQLEKIKMRVGYNISYNNNGVIIRTDDGNNRFILLKKQPDILLNNTQKPKTPQYYFNLNILDTSIYSNYFRYVKSLPINNYSVPPVIADANRNKRLEIYGSRKEIYNPIRSGLLCYEEDARGIYREIYRFPDSIVATRDFFDPDNDGKKELLTSGTRIDSTLQVPYRFYPFFRKDSSTSVYNSYFFPISIYDTISGWQLNDITVLDLDLNNTMDVILWDFTIPTIWIGRYDTLKKEFVKVISFLLINGTGNERDYISSFVTGDLNNDGKIEAVCSSVYGNIYLIQYDGLSSYTMKLIGNTGIPNSYIAFKSSDLNGNGKPEIWLGGIDFDIGKTILSGYEFEGNDVLEQFCEIQFINEANLLQNSGNVLDVDGDGREEIVLELEKKVVVLKMNMNGNSLEPSIFYFKNFNAPAEGFDPYNITLLREPVNDSLLLLVAGTKTVGRDYRTETHIYSYGLISDIGKILDNGKNDLSLKFFPNPVHKEVTFEIQLSSSMSAELSVVNILGEVIKKFDIQADKGGKEKITWNCTDDANKKLVTGIYFLVLNDGRKIKVNKLSFMSKELK